MGFLPDSQVNAPPKLSNETQDLTTQCKIVIYDWTLRSLALNSGHDAALSKTTSLDVSSQVISCNFSKSLGNASGSFSFTLSNSPGYGSGDWKDLIKRGTWCVIYMSQEGDLLLNPKVGPPNSKSQKKQEAEKIRCIGFIDRVAVSSEMGERGAFDVTYEVSGRDFGVVYEDTTIWHNVFKFDTIMLDAVRSSGLNVAGNLPTSEVIKIVHNLFYNPKAIKGAAVNSLHSLVSIALQWLMPRQMLVDIGLKVGNSPFWGEVPDILQIAPTSSNMPVSNPVDFLSGNAWETLKRLAVLDFHELFTETDDNGLPHLNFRPRPWAIDKSKYPTVGKHIGLYRDLPAVRMKALDIISFNLGEDNHSRYNSFLVTVATSLINVNDNIAFLEGKGFPKNLQDSIKRYGFRNMHVSVNSFTKNAEFADGRSNASVLVEFNEVLYDYWNNAVFSESGEIHSVGNNFVKVGKCMVFDEKTPYVFGKRYYIEGYTDSFSVDEKGVGTWVQTINLTRGFNEVSLRTKSGFGDRHNAFDREGEFTPSGASSGGDNQK